MARIVVSLLTNVYLLQVPNLMMRKRQIFADDHCDGYEKWQAVMT
jgi:hypothetical protein